MSFATTCKLLAAILSSAFAADADALFRAYLSADGNDANPCTLPAPCRLLPAALAAVDAGGQIWMLDSANYNTATVTIAKSVSVLAVPGVVGSVLAIGGPAVSIATGGIKVSLRNVAIGNLAGAGGTHGVNVNASSTQVTLEDCLVENVPGRGINLVNASKVQVANCTIRNVGDTAVRVEGNGSVMVTRSRLLSNAVAVSANAGQAGNATATVTDSVVAGGSTGISASSVLEGAYANVIATGNTIEGNYAALSVTTVGAAVATLVFSGNTITNNEFSYYVIGIAAGLISKGHNNITANTSTFGDMFTGSLQ